MSSLITVKKWAGFDGRWHARGRDPVVIDPTPDPVTYRHTRALVSGALVVTPPVDPPDPPGTRNEGAGSLLPGLQTYPVPTTGVVRYVDPTNGGDTFDGSIDTPWRTVAKAASSVGANATIVLRGYNATTNPTCSGIYHEGAVPGGAPGGAANGVYFQTVGLAVMAYPREEVWWDGSRVVSGWVSHSSTVWKKTGWGQFGAGAGIPAFDRSPTATRGAGDTNTSEGGSWIYIDPAFPIAMWGEQVFIDGAPLTQVATLAEVGPGKFFLEGTLKGGTGADKNLFAGSTCYIGTNPLGKEIRASDLSCAFILQADNVTAKGFGVRRYMPALYDNAVVKLNQIANKIENLWIQHISSTGVSCNGRADMVVNHCSILDTGFRGGHAHQTNNITWSNNRIERADKRRFNAAPECGGIKITQSNKCTFDGNVFRDNDCHALWTDASVGNVRMINNDLFFTRGHGIINELAGDCIVANNRIIGTGKIAIYSNSSNGVRCWNNTVLQVAGVPGNTGEVVIDLNSDSRRYATLSYGQDRRASAYSPMTWFITTYEQKNNVVGVIAGNDTYIWRTRSNLDDGWRTTADMGVQSDGNLWVKVGSVPGTPFMMARAGGGTGYSNLAGYKAAYPALETRSQQVATNVFDADYSLTSAAETTYAAVPVPAGLPADIAALLGKPTGTVHLGAFI